MAFVRAGRITVKFLVLSNLYPPHYLGGYEVNCHRTARALQTRGHEIHVLTSTYGIENPKATANEAGITRVLRIHGMFGAPWLGIFQLEKLERDNNAILRKTISDFKPDLVYVWNMGGLSKSMLFTLQKIGVPTVFFVSDHWVARCEKADVWLNWWNQKDPSVPQRILRGVWNLSGRRQQIQQIAPTNPVRHLRFPRIYFCSRALRDGTAEAGFDVRHGGVIYCPVDIQRFQAVPRTAAQPLKNFLYVGRLHEDKGVMTALRAIALVRGQFNGHLNIVGRGEPDYEAKLKSFVAENKLPVTFSSVSNPDEMPKIYAANDALLFTSEWPEPFAITPLEAMASGLPVIATTTGGSIELFRHKENALTYEAGNAEQLAERILELTQNNSLRGKIAVAGHCEVREKFSEDKIVSQIDDYLRETLQTWRAPGLSDFRS